MTAPAPDPHEPPQSPFKLNGTRITILVLVILAVLLIIGAVSGGLSNYQQLREATPQQVDSKP